VKQVPLIDLLASLIAQNMLNIAKPFNGFYQQPINGLRNVRCWCCE